MRATANRTKNLCWEARAKPKSIWTRQPVKLPVAEPQTTTPRQRSARGFLKRLRQFASAFEKYSVNGDTMRKLEKQDLEGVVDHPLHRAKIVGGWENLGSNYVDCTKRTQK